MLNMPREQNRGSTEYSDGFVHDYRQKGLLIVKTRFLTITFSYKANLICLNLSIYSSLPLINPLPPYGFYYFRVLYKVLHFVRIYRF